MNDGGTWVTDWMLSDGFLMHHVPTSRAPGSFAFRLLHTLHSEQRETRRNSNFVQIRRDFSPKIVPTCSHNEDKK